MITVPLKPKRSCLLLLASSLQDCVRGKNLSLFIAWLRVRAVDCPFQITALQILLPLISTRTPHHQITIVTKQLQAPAAKYLAQYIFYNLLGTYGTFTLHVTYPLLFHLTLK